jgi:hypothetical protein
MGHLPKKPINYKELKKKLQAPAEKSQLCLGKSVKSLYNAHGK